MFDAFLEIDGIPGESTDGKHKNQIELLSYSHGLIQTSSGSVSSGGGRGAERCDHGSFSCVKNLDKATPKLAEAICKGTHIPKVTLRLCRAAGDKTQYMEYAMENVIVDSLSYGGSSGGESALPVETVSFNYGKITWKYTETDHKTGAAKGDVQAGWDLEANAPA
ncbi:MAG: Hcp family type VI secretion system effector [Phycisphaerales bacterium JB037]|jgi:type VI secretion system secreted protein Hcp